MRRDPDKRGRWRLWHPFQGLWNRDLVDRIRTTLPRRPYRLLLGAIVLVDSAVLFARAVERRRSKLGLGKLWSRSSVPDGISIFYFDLGMHKEAKELHLMATRVLPRFADHFEAYGFEASQSFYDQALQRFADQKQVKLVRAAVCHDLPPGGGKLRLYKRDAERGSASLYRDGFGSYEEVDALRFSDWLRDNKIDLENSIGILRMNIEGAEYDVILDLVESGVAKQIVGYYGMWDDVGKIDPDRGAKFRELLEQNGIKPFTFNGRDMRFGFRRKTIEYDLDTSVQEGLERLRRRARA